MMKSEFLTWFSGGFAFLIGVSGVIIYIIKNSILRYATKSIEYKFEKEIEGFKADIRAGESELEQLRKYISSAMSSRDSLLQAKRFEATESLMKICKNLYEFNMVVVYMKILNLEEISKNISNPKVQYFIDSIVSSVKLDEIIEEYKKIDVDTPLLYLSDRTIKAFKIYQSIIMVGVGTLKILSLKLENTTDIIKGESLIDQMVKYLPSTSEGFQKYGYTYAFNWHDYFREEVLKELRREVNGASSIEIDTESAVQLGIKVREAHQRLKDDLRRRGLGDNLINKEV